MYLVRSKNWIPAHQLSEYAEISPLVVDHQLPDLFFAPPSWTVRALCVDLDAELFYGGADDREPRTRFDRALAISVCEQCPVRAQCLQRAVEHRQYYGIWGGTDIRTRALLIRKAKHQPPQQVVSEFLAED